jgi:hypothetical protein
VDKEVDKEAGTLVALAVLARACLPGRRMWPVAPQEPAWNVLAHCSLPIARCPLLVAHCLLRTAPCSLLRAPCPQLTAHCSLLTTHCSHAHPDPLHCQVLPGIKGQVTALGWGRRNCAVCRSKEPPARMDFLAICVPSSLASDSSVSSISLTAASFQPFALVRHASRWCHRLLRLLADNVQEVDCADAAPGLYRYLCLYIFACTVDPY